MTMNPRAPRLLTLATGLLSAGGICGAVAAQNAPVSGAWTFLAAGDARNCGDIVMPAIAETARARRVAFYWHLGDSRWTSVVDEDIANQPEQQAAPLSIDAYHEMEWQDVVANQMAPFGAIPFLAGIGNHEVIYPKTRTEFLLTFAPWLDTPALRAQRQRDTPDDPSIKTYFHWIDRGVSFFYLDNASNDEFNATQLAWFERALNADVANPAVATIIAGMHKALPDGYNVEHSMNESPTSTETGRRVYADLLKARDGGHKRVYVLASHQHFFMANAYDSPYWRDHGGVLPGWIAGTAGAQRYALPTPSPKVAMTNVYGSLLGKIAPNGEVAFEFVRITEGDVPAAITRRYGRDFVHWCFAFNRAAAVQIK
jgi:hypothetical protein